VSVLNWFYDQHLRSFRDRSCPVGAIVSRGQARLVNQETGKTLLLRPLEAGSSTPVALQSASLTGLNGSDRPFQQPHQHTSPTLCEEIWRRPT
jgi:hypothetical protein